MERTKLALLSAVLAVGYIVTSVISAPQTLSGLSAVLGTIVLASAPMLTAFGAFQLIVSLALIATLVFSEFTDQAYGSTSRFFVLCRVSWVPYVVFLLVVFSLLLALRISAILSP